MNPKELIEDIRRLEEEIRIKKVEITSLNEMLGKKLRGDESTENRALDLAILSKYSLNEADGQPLYEFERALQDHPGELVLIEARWQEDWVKHAVTGQTGLMPTHEHWVSEYLIGVVDQQPRFRYVEKRGLTYPIKSFIVTEQRLDFPVQTLSSPDDGLALGLWNPELSSIHSHFLTWQPSSEPEANYAVGNRAVAASIKRHIFSGGDVSSNPAVPNTVEQIFTALGMEVPSEYSRGRLAAPDPSTD